MYDAVAYDTNHKYDTRHNHKSRRESQARGTRACTLGEHLRRLISASGSLSPRMVHVIEDLAGDWRRLDERIDGLSDEIEAIARRDAGCERLMSVPGIGQIISSAMVAAIGAGDAFPKGRDFAAWLGL